MKKILTIFLPTASTGAQTRTRLGNLMTTPLLREDREKQRHKRIEQPTLTEVQALRLFQPMIGMLQNRKRSQPAPSLARPTPAMKQIKCAKVKAEPNEAARTSSACLRSAPLPQTELPKQRKTSWAKRKKSELTLTATSKHLAKAAKTVAVFQISTIKQL